MARFRDALSSLRARAALLLVALVSLTAVLAPLSAHAPAQPRASTARSLSAGHVGLELLPAAAQGKISSVVGADDPAYRVHALSGGRFLARNARMSVTFDRLGVSVAEGATRLALRLRSVAPGGRGAALAPLALRARANEVEYSYPSLTAWYRNGPAGMEQGFVLERPPLAGSRSGSAGSDLTLTLGVRSNARYEAARDGQSVSFTRGAATALRLGSLLVTDASGRTLPSSLAVVRGELRLQVRAAGARYPITIDPMLQPGSLLTGSGETGAGELGLSVAVSEDGTTALVGAPHDNNFAGAVWVFVRSGTTWTQQGEKLLAGGPAEQTGCSEEPIFNSLEESECGFGTSVAISGDGNTALVGSPRDDALRGGAWVFTRSGNTWSREQQELIGPGEVGEGHFGKTVVLSGDGTVALVSAPSDAKGHGAVWGFERTPSGWVMMGEGKITPSEELGASFFGRGLAISPDGTTALIGGPGDHGYAGAAWLFTREGSRWTQRAKITGGEESGAGRFGYAVALSEGGESALVGAPRDQANVGAAWLFTGSGDALTQDGPKLTAAEEVGEGLLGRSVALSASGRIALVGAPRDANGYGAAFIFRRSLAGVTSEKFSAEKGLFGASVAISSDGNMPLFGEPLGERKAGVAWAGLPPAQVSAVEPSGGPAGGGTSVTITGAGFTEVTGVYFGERPAAYEVRSSSSIVAVSPAAGSGGIVDVTVATTHGTSPATPADLFTYIPAEGASEAGSGGEGASEEPASEEESGTLGFSGAAAPGCRFALASKKVRVLSRGRAAARLRHLDSRRCTAKLTLTVRVRAKHGRFKARSIGSTRFSIAGAKPVTVIISLSGFGRSLLRAGHGRANASLVLVPIKQGPARAQTVSVRLRLG